LEAPVIPAKAGIQSVGSGFPKGFGVDSRFRGNDWRFQRDPTPNDTSIRLDDFFLGRQLADCSRRQNMDLNRWLRLIAGAIVLGTLLLGYYVNPKWFLFTGFVALNLIHTISTSNVEL
jgi:hypothetical protein